MRDLLRTHLKSTILTRTVELAPSVSKSLKQLPPHVIDKLMTWVSSVEQFGLENVRRVPGYHDEPLKGKRAGQRSIRLSLHYRAIYVVKREATTLARIIDVNKHRY